METYLCVLLVLTRAFAFITCARIAYLMSYRRWDFDNTQSFIIALAMGGVAAVLAGMLVSALAEQGGFVFALAGSILTMPLVGAVWLFVLGFNKAIERILKGLHTKLD